MKLKMVWKGMCMLIWVLEYVFYPLFSTIELFPTLWKFSHSQPDLIHQSKLSLIYFLLLRYTYSTFLDSKNSCNANRKGLLVEDECNMIAMGTQQVVVVFIYSQYFYITARINDLF